ncbi:MAG: hypothetical protein HY257_04690 [Chloroflexi bacterium]|nr:hypothetical protein [Chloroflexota bacterium]
MKNKLKTKSCFKVPVLNAKQLFDTKRAPYSTFGTGVKKGNPRKCTGCGQNIKDCETWELSASAADPKYGRIVTIRHSPRCPDEQARETFQQMLARG